MNYFQYLRIIWARRWLVAITFLVFASLGIGAAVLLVKPRFVAEATLVFDNKPDPTTPNGGWAPQVDIGTQIDIMQSPRVAERAVAIAGLDKDPDILKAWKERGEGKVSIEKFASGAMIDGLKVEPSRTSNLVTLVFSADSAKAAADGANALAQAYLDVSVDLRVAPARQYAKWFEEQSAVLRADLERAQQRLSKFQQDRKIVGQDEKIDEEIARLNILTGQLAEAQAQRADAASRGAFSGGEFSADVQQSPVVASLRAELARLEARLSEISNVVGTNHPQRIGLESQIQETRRQITAEMRRVSGGTAANERAQARKVAELQSLVDQQRSKVLNMRGARDEISVLIKDVENAQRAYETARTRMSELALQSANQQAQARILTPAIEPQFPRTKRPAAMVASVLAAAVAGLVLAVFLEALDPKVRGIEDLAAVDNVPVIGVLQAANARAPAYRRFAIGGPLASPKRLLGVSSPGTES
jgi:chain length determinant protein EpsF